MFMLLNIYKGRDMFDSLVREGSFHKAIHLKIDDNFELFNKTILIIGCGRIGKKLIKKCLGFDMNVLVFDPYVDEKTISSLGAQKISDFDYGLKILDILSLSVPLNDETKHMISIKELSLMKKTAIIINASRGGVVNEIDLDRALNEKIISFAGLDVFEGEPKPKIQILMNDYVSLSPHIGASTLEAQDRIGIELAEQIKTLLND